MDEATLAREKSALRKQYRALRRALGDPARAAASLAICERIASWELFQRSRTILSYMPIQFEVDLTPLLARFPQKRWALPRIVPGEDHRMLFHLYDAARLEYHPFGMAEPAPDSPLVAPQEVELTLVPGMAYDRTGMRLGYGGGYYDRFLRDYHGVAVGVAFQALLVDPLPRGAHDVPLRWVVTENGLIRCEAVASSG
jgi:5-formyltetrahydrofolate cyclo-ligase